MSSDSYAYINLEAINDIADGDSEFIREIITNYGETVSNSLEGLSEAISGADAERIVFFAHKLKGSYAFVGADQLHGLVQEIESNPTGGPALQTNFSELLRLSQSVDGELEAVLRNLDLA